MPVDVTDLRLRTGTNSPTRVRDQTQVRGKTLKYAHFPYEYMWLAHYVAYECKRCGADVVVENRGGVSIAVFTSPAGLDLCGKADANSVAAAESHTCPH
jgi:hypothetical protein